MHFLLRVAVRCSLLFGDQQLSRRGFRNDARRSRGHPGTRNPKYSRSGQTNCGVSHTSGVPVRDWEFEKQLEILVHSQISTILPPKGCERGAGVGGL
jgi:hypothetical protein